MSESNIAIVRGIPRKRTIVMQVCDIQKGAPFAGGKGGRGDTLPRAFLVVDEGPVGSGPAERRLRNITGLRATKDRLNVSCPYDNTIKVFDAESMARLAEWAVERPGVLAMDGKGDFSPGESPGLAGTFGVPGGIYAHPSGRFGDLRFNMPSAVGSDADGNIYVAHRGSTGGGSTALESYTPQGRLNWRLFGLHCVDMADDVDKGARWIQGERRNPQKFVTLKPGINKEMADYLNALLAATPKHRQ
jgi:hypothetical protein